MIPKGTRIDEQYTVVFSQHEGAYAFSFRVKDQENVTLFLKLMPYSKLHPTQLLKEGKVAEIELLKKIDHPNIVEYRDSGTWVFLGERYVYLVLDYIKGETLQDRIRRESTVNWREFNNLFSGMLNGLKYLHANGILHNDISPRNIMLSLTGKVPIAKVIDFGYARLQSSPLERFQRDGLSEYYLANEALNGVFSKQSDIFSAAATMYHALYGIPPWHGSVSKLPMSQAKKASAIIEARRKPLKQPLLSDPAGLADLSNIPRVLTKAMSFHAKDRFASVEEMLEALHNPKITLKSNETKQKLNVHTEIKDEKRDGGFKDIAGMQSLKETLRDDVLEALKKPEIYEEYGLEIPNGMLLYGPPGCGKSFFAEKLAEEAGYHYELVKPSTLASIYVHGSQEKIGKLFDKAREHAPTILNFEEFDALVPKRDSHAGRNQSGEVNEFLVQLNGCGKHGVFVIATTNQPQLIDPAVLRAGRIDKIFYVPPPDSIARKEMFSMLLNNRPVDFGIDYEQLAKLTENYMSVDIQHLVNEASRKALKQRTKITQNILEQTISNVSPSVPISVLQSYDGIKSQIEGGNDQKGRNRPPIGFIK